MKNPALLFAGLVFALGFSTAAFADERADHFSGEPAETLNQAVANFSDYNGQLAIIVAKDALEPEDMLQVHQLTYTLENALEKIRTELADLADTLEAVHVASERMEADAVKTQGRKYLQVAAEVIP
ncbi:MAG TPA: DUF6746 family protein [Lysobacter sp.]|jgi:hypothetical protein|nr:DUF6746 family protein [Lysobacter sp.]